jgi:HAD superfamily hydrolase (TIGR01509 family)
MIQAVLFDLDGLLIDSENLHFLSWQQTLAGVNVALDEPTYFDHWTRAGGGIRDFCTSRGMKHDLAMLRRRKAELYTERVLNELCLMPGALECLDQLRGRKRLAIATSSYAESVHLALGKFKLEHYFQAIVTREDVKQVKPAPDTFLRAAELLDVLPKECVVVEDAEKGVIAARAAGMACIAVPNHHTQDNDFSQATLGLPSLHELTLATIDTIK